MSDRAAATDSADEPALAFRERARPFAPPRGNRWAPTRRTAAVLVVFCVMMAIVPFGYRFVCERQRADFKQQCKAALTAKDLQHVLDVSRAWRNSFPQDDDALMFTAQAAVELEQLDLAVETLGEVSDRYHGALQALAMRAEILQSGLNRIYDAEATWLRMLSIQPRADLPRQRLIFFYAMTLQREKMAAQIEEAIRLGCEPPEAYTYLIMKDVLNFSDGLAQTTHWRMTYPEDQTLEVAQAVYAAKHAGDQKLATIGAETVAHGDRSLIDKCLVKYPANLEVLSIHLDYAIFEGDTDRVLELLRQAPAEAESDNRFWRARGWLLMTDGRHAEAAATFQQGIEQNPFDWQARWLLADVSRKLGRLKEADELSALAARGKELQRLIFERPNARDVDQQLLNQIHSYLQQIGPSVVLTGLENRL